MILLYFPPFFTFKQRYPTLRNLICSLGVICLLPLTLGLGASLRDGWMSGEAEDSVCGKSLGERTEAKGQVGGPEDPFIEGDVWKREDRGTDEGEGEGLENFSRPRKAHDVL